MKLVYVFIVSLIGVCFLIYNTYLFTFTIKVRNKVSKLFLGYLILLSIVEVICNCIGILYPNTTTNYFISHFYFILQLAFLSGLYYTLFKERIIKLLIIIVFVIQLLILANTYYVKPQLFWEFNSYEIVSISFILVIYALLYIFKNIQNEHTYFNFSVGLILYSTCSITLFMSGSLELVLCQDPYIDIWVFNSLFYIVFQYFVYKEFLFFKNKIED